MALTLTITREIPPSQVVDLCDLLRGPRSSWLERVSHMRGRLAAVW